MEDINLEMQASATRAKALKLKPHGRAGQSRPVNQKGSNMKSHEFESRRNPCTGSKFSDLKITEIQLSEAEIDLFLNKLKQQEEEKHTMKQKLLLFIAKRLSRISIGIKKFAIKLRIKALQK